VAEAEIPQRHREQQGCRGRAEGRLVEWLGHRAERAACPAGPWAGRRHRAPQQQDVDGVQDGHGDAEHGAERRVRPVGTGTGQASDERDAGEQHGQCEQEGSLRPFTEHEPGEDRHEEHLEIAKHRREPGTDRGDRMAP
jgi:hypothetical protein